MSERKWYQVTQGRRWHYKSSDGKLLGFVTRCWDGWDAYVLTGLPFKDGADKCVNLGGDRNYYKARKAVEAETDNAEGKPTQATE